MHNVVVTLSDRLSLWWSQLQPPTSAGLKIPRKNGYPVSKRFGTQAILFGAQRIWYPVSILFDTWFNIIWYPTTYILKPISNLPCEFQTILKPNTKFCSYQIISKPNSRIESPSTKQHSNSIPNCIESVLRDMWPAMLGLSIPRTQIQHYDILATQK